MALFVHRVNLPGCVPGASSSGFRLRTVVMSMPGRLLAAFGQVLVFDDNDKWSYGLLHFSASEFAFACADFSAVAYPVDVFEHAEFGECFFDFFGFGECFEGVCNYEWESAGRFRFGVRVFGRFLCSLVAAMAERRASCFSFLGIVFGYSCLRLLVGGLVFRRRCLGRIWLFRRRLFLGEPWRLPYRFRVILRWCVFQP